MNTYKDNQLMQEIMRLNKEKDKPLQEQINNKKGNTQENNKREDKKSIHRENNVAGVLKCLSIIFGVLGFYNGLKILDNSKTEMLGVIIVMVALVFATLVFAIGEIIQKLQNIEDNTKKE